ncbi:lys-63-specific deubiquitinase BRCC36 isoform X2 [Leptinotarsa decemlineata]|uniref:lys-63-specific deubiquitinase BRCC36 isoform X2 n=1 Tax=Leptinotarsa decemlineata TaxID=7539 RepID=UPI003D309048
MILKTQNIRVDETECTSRIKAVRILNRSDKHADRVEISPNQLVLAVDTAEQLEDTFGKPLKVLGWYHSHPHITVDPSGIDVNTQAGYQVMSIYFIGLIFSVFNIDSATKKNKIHLTCFQASGHLRKDVELVIQSVPLRLHTLREIAGLPDILVREEEETCESNAEQDELAILHNDTLKTIKLVQIVSNLTRRISDDLEERSTTVSQRIKILEKMKRELQNDLQSL